MKGPLDEAVDWVCGGGLLAYPTETVWGLGADARSDPALARLRRWKGRTADAPVSILVAAVDALPALGIEVGPTARQLAARFWPGPVTLVLPCRDGFAEGVARADGAVGVRCSSHPTAAGLARRLAERKLGPLTATSLNRSGGPAARDRHAARAACGDAQDAPRWIAGLAELGGDAGGEPESTVIDVCGERPEVLRWGAIDEPLLRSALEEIAA